MGERGAKAGSGKIFVTVLLHSDPLLFDMQHKHVVKTLNFKFDRRQNTLYHFAAFVILFNLIFNVIIL